MAHVFAFTVTKNRLELMQLQAVSLISKLVPKLTEKQKDKIDKIVEDKVIKVLSIYGFDSEDCCSSGFLSSEINFIVINTNPWLNHDQFTVYLYHFTNLFSCIHAR
jgi:hypothetical protein